MKRMNIFNLKYNNCKQYKDSSYLNIKQFCKELYKFWCLCVLHKMILKSNAMHILF